MAETPEPIADGDCPNPFRTWVLKRFWPWRSGMKTLPKSGMVQKRPISGNTWTLSAHPERSRVRAGLSDFVVDVLKPQLRANRVYPRSSSQ
jgi:hypothetical protein